MLNASEKYKRLPGKKKNFLIGYYTLWLGADHLLIIFSRFGIEDYKRFYFKDIQAVITRKTSAGKIQNIILGFFCTLFMLLSLFLKGGWSVFNWSMFGLMTLFLLINWLRGPTCVSHIQTAVQTEKLYSLYRMKTAIKVMNRLRPLIEQAQGKLTNEDIKEKAVKASKVKTSQARTGKDDLSLKKDGVRVHKNLYSLLIFYGLFGLLDFFYSHVILTVFENTLFMVACILVIIALVRQHDGNLKSSLRVVTWTTFGYLCLSMLTGYIIYFIIAFREPGMARNQWEMIKALSQISPMDSPMMMGIFIFSVCGSLIIGLSGLIITRRGQSNYAEPGSSAM